MKTLLIGILAVVAIFGVSTCLNDESKKHCVGGVSHEEISHNVDLVRKSKEWESMAKEVR